MFTVASIFRMSPLQDVATHFGSAASLAMSAEKKDFPLN
jgi:hypothetical protein